MNEVKPSLTGFLDGPDGEHIMRELEAGAIDRSTFDMASAVMELWHEDRRLPRAELIARCQAVQPGATEEQITLAVQLALQCLEVAASNLASRPH